MFYALEQAAPCTQISHLKCIKQNSSTCAPQKLTGGFPTSVSSWLIA